MRTGLFSHACMRRRSGVEGRIVWGSAWDAFINELDLTDIRLVVARSRMRDASLGRASEGQCVREIVRFAPVLLALFDASSIS